MIEGLTGKRILIIEDEYLIAADLKRALVDAGAVIVGPAATLEAGQILVEEDIDLALLDVNLDGEHCYPLASRLRDRSVPFVFLTGYDEWALPPEYRDVPRIGKPFPLAQLIDQLSALSPAAQT